MNCCSPGARPNGGEAKKSSSYQRTFTGCWRCRERKVKCDKLQPSCSPCKKLGLRCSGYRQNLVWVSADQKTYRHNGRRYQEPSHTWKNEPVLSSKCLDDLISNCDFEFESGRDDISCLPFSAFRASPRSSEQDSSIAGNNLPFEDVPFDVEDVSTSHDDSNSLQSYSIVYPDDSRGAPTEYLANSTGNSQYPPIDTPVTTDPSLLIIPPSIRAENRLNHADLGLFKVYLLDVAPTLVPVHEARNPWLRYPAIALHLSFQEGRNHLLHALMAHAAFGLGHKGFNQDAMFALGTRLYSLAMAELRLYLQEESADYVGLLTTILTFLLLELSRGSSKAWRYHLKAAWRFLQHEQNSKAWASSVDAWYVTQSFYLLKTGSDSCGFICDDANDAGDDTTNGVNGVLAQEVMCNPGYGWTLGTSSSVMETIAEINAVAAQLEHNETDSSTATIPIRLNQTLLEYQREVLALSNLEANPRHLHLQAFQAATLIYYYQTCDQLPPRKLSHLVSAVLGFLSTFFEICGGSFTLWPIFVAAAESYQEDEQSRFITLLEKVGNAGMRDISNYITLLKRIWDVRGLRAAIDDREIADTRVDWREVMRGLEMDVLIL